MSEHGGPTLPQGRGEMPGDAVTVAWIQRHRGWLVGVAAVLLAAGLMIVILAPAETGTRLLSGALGVSGVLVGLVSLIGFGPAMTEALDQVRAQEQEGAAPTPNQAAIRHRAARRIAQVQDEYASRLTDIAYVIEHQGMFDLSHEPARELATLLAQAQDFDPQAGELTQLRQLAGELQTSWSHAQQYAERLGYAALRGDQTAARQAAGLSRKAASPGVSEPERQALLERVRLILATADLVIPRPMSGQLGSPVARALTTTPEASTANKEPGPPRSGAEVPRI